MKSKPVLSVLLAAILIAPLGANADAVSQRLAQLVKLGQWQTAISEKIYVPGAMTQTHTATLKYCIKKRNVGHPAAVAVVKQTMASDGMTCRTTKRDLSGNTLHIKLHCRNPKNSFNFTVTKVFSSPTMSTSHVVGTGRIVGTTGRIGITGMKIVVDGQSKRVGKCTGSAADSKPSKD